METTGKKRIWQESETRAFIDAYAARAEEFSHAKKRNTAMANVLEDLLSQNILTQPTSEEMLKTKFKNLMQAYKSAKDNSNRTGAGSIHVPFQNELDELFGDRPIISSSHCRSLSANRLIIQVDEDVAEEERQAQIEHIDVDELEFEGTTAKQNVAPKTMRKESYYREKLNILKSFTEKKIKLAEIAEKNKNERHRERMQKENEKISLLRKLLNKKNK